ncbi:MAG: hydrogenase 3 maturation endopeptidase HyCI [Syntrophothermus sp.]
MSLNSWQTDLHPLLEQQSARQNRPPRIAILGIGNALRSDDAAGILVARGLAQSRIARELHFVRVIDAGHAPENRTVELRPFDPELVILVDAAEMGKAPGAAHWVGIDEIDGMSASTHSMPLSMLAKYLTLEFGCEVRVLGIQPQSNELGESISREVLGSVEKIVQGLARFLSSFSSAEFQI